MINHAARYTIASKIKANILGIFPDKNFRSKSLTLPLKEKKNEKMTHLQVKKKIYFTEI